MERGARNRLDAKDAKQTEEQQKYGIYDPRNGKALVMPEGQPLLDKADRLEYAANHAGDPTASATLLAQAADLHAVRQPRAKYGFRTPQAEATKASLEATQTFVDTARQIKDLLDSDPGFTDRAAWQTAKTAYELAKTDLIAAKGLKASSREMEAFDGVMGTIRRSTLPGLVALESCKLQSTTASASVQPPSETCSMRKASGLPRVKRYGRLHRQPRTYSSSRIEPLQSRRCSPEPILSPSIAGVKVLTKLILPGVDKQIDDANIGNPGKQAEEAADLTPTGLSKKDDTAERSLIRDYETAPKSLKGDDSKAQILTHFTQIVSNTNRPELASAVLGLLKGEDPELYQQVVSSLPRERQKELDNSDLQKQIPAKSIDLKSGGKGDIPERKIGIPGKEQ